MVLYQGSVISFRGFLLFDRGLISHLFDKLDAQAGGDHGVCVRVSGVTMLMPGMGDIL